jgi:hypothetical protein
MEENKFHIIVVDDTMGEKDPFIVELKLDYQKTANVSYFTKVDDAMTFVDEHMSERMIIIMDCRFGSVWQGVDAVMKLREKTSLVYVIMISANNVNQLSSNDIMSLINTDNIYFIKNTDIAGAKEKIDKIQSLWKVRFDCVLEQWLIRHPEDNSKEAFSEVSTGKTYTWEDILVELRKQTSVGKSFEKKLNDYYIHQLNRMKK